MTPREDLTALTEIVQLVPRPDVFELGAGQPGPDTLPNELLSTAARRVLERGPFGSLAYGAPGGPASLRERIAARLDPRGEYGLEPPAVMITGGASQALDLVLASATRPGQTVLVEDLTYDLALPILRDHGLEVCGVPCDKEGMLVDVIPELIAGLREAGGQVPLLYCIPTFHNPTGRMFPLDRRIALADMLDRENIVAIEDDPYREIVFDGECPPPLWALAPAGRVVWLGSFSKTLAPGLRVGWLVADRPRVEGLARRGVTRSGGGVNHFAAMVIAELLRADAFGPHVAQLCATYRARRDALVATLGARLPEDCWTDLPRGGFFVWLRLPEGLDPRAVRSSAESAGVSCYDSTRFSTTSCEPALRLSISFCTREMLVEAGARLATVLANARATAGGDVVRNRGEEAAGRRSFP